MNPFGLVKKGKNDFLSASSAALAIWFCWISPYRIGLALSLAGKGVVLHRPALMTFF